MIWLNKLPLFFAIFLLMACAKSEYPEPKNSIDVSWQHPQADFHLLDANGKPRSLSDYRGKVLVLFFGYTHCPEVCPTTLADLAQVVRVLGQEAKKVQVIFITLDPERDTADMLSKYVPSYDPSFVGLWGDSQATAQAAKSFGVNYQKQADKHGGYTLDHTDSIYLIGLEGKPLWMSRYGQSADLLSQDIKMLMTINR